MKLTTHFSMIVFAINCITILNAEKSSKPLASCITTNGEIISCPSTANQRNFLANSTLSAYAHFHNRINETGWAELEVTTSPKVADDQQQAYYAGFLEGFLTAQLITPAFANMLPPKRAAGYCEQLGGLLEQTLNSTVEKVLKNQGDPYWQQVGLTLNQLAGLEDGYQYSIFKGGNSEMEKKYRLSKPHMNIRPCGLLLLNLRTELGDLQSILNQTLLEKKVDHCSALIKITPSGEVLTAHNSWTSYTWMLRVLKKYSLNFRSSHSAEVAFSSYPGVIFSIDDFYITSARLVILETSIANFNAALWADVKLGHFTFEFIRNSVANRLAVNGSHWAEVFSQENGGTYNNQFMIVDYKKAATKSSGLLTVLEQLPGMIAYSDRTAALLKTSYHASYNVPMYEVIYSASGYEEMAARYGDFFSYQKTARARIFARDQARVTNLTSLYRLMRYNDMFHDPLSRCEQCTPKWEGKYAIAARADLNDPNGSYPIPFIGFQDEGAIDAKMTSGKLVDNNLQMVAVSGPTGEQVPAFSWATTKLRNAPHVDQPAGEWRFKPVKTVWGGSDEGKMVGFPEFGFDE